MLIQLTKYAIRRQVCRIIKFTDKYLILKRKKKPRFFLSLFKHSFFNSLLIITTFTMNSLGVLCSTNDKGRQKLLLRFCNKPKFSKIEAFEIEYF
jgi:hypothetical protein